tara:strand:+ start:176 stop:589 length:414 start_codon:yes stop_codon:yes gene_type:complete
MKDYNQIYKTGAGQADSLLKKADISNKESQMSTAKVEEITALLALRNAEEKRFKNFEGRYNELINSDRMVNILSDVEPTSAREAYQSGVMSISKDVNISVKDIEAYVSLQSIIDDSESDDTKSDLKDLLKGIMGRIK